MLLFFKSWCENIIVGVLISVIIEMICPERFLKYVKIVVGVFIMYLIISPIISKINYYIEKGNLDDIAVYSKELVEDSKNININNNSFDNNINVINKIFIDGVIINIREKIKEKLNETVEIDIEYDIEKNEIIKIKVSGNIIDAKQIKNIILEELDVNENIIFVN